MRTNTKRTTTKPATATKRSSSEGANGKHEAAIASLAKPLPAVETHRQNAIVAHMLTGPGLGQYIATDDVAIDRDREIATLIAYLGRGRDATFFEADGDMVAVAECPKLFPGNSAPRAASVAALLSVWMLADDDGHLYGWHAIGEDWRIVDCANHRLLEHRGELVAVIEASGHYTHDDDKGVHIHTLWDVYRDEERGVPTVPEVLKCLGLAAAGVTS
jgi:hypothetical protein